MFSVFENNLSGTIPLSFANLSSLREIDAESNAFNETISSSALPSSIRGLGLSFSHNVLISETLLSNLSHLSWLTLQNCVLNISTSLIPSFQLSDLFLESCKMNGQFPLWISTQYSLKQLKLTGNNLVGEVPSWVWDTSVYLSHLDFSNNQLKGNLFANTSLWKGPSYMRVLALHDNLLSGNIPPLLGTFSELQVLNLGNNNFTGYIPPALASCSELQVLNLGNNSLKGSTPRWFGKLSKLFSLQLSYNNLEGTFPHSITNCSNLEFLDVGHNSLEGHIPKSVKHLSVLRVLVLRENHFGGDIPPEIGQLMQLQILDLSSNGFLGSIPYNISCLKAMGIASHEGFVLSNIVSTGFNTYGSYGDGLYMTSKGVYLHYVYIYSTFTVIDLSNNRLSGEIPSDLGNLKGLRQLNLSMNYLSSSIPDSLGEMSLLESLDLSTNRFSGKIPWMLDSLNNLGVLNLANNNLSGSIPQGSRLITFAEPSYSGNPYLWGCPLPKNCSWPQYASPSTSKIVEARSIKIPWYGIALGLSYGAGFGGTVTLIAIFYQKYFEKVDLILKLLFPCLNNWIV